MCSQSLSITTTPSGQVFLPLDNDSVATIQNRGKNYVSGLCFVYSDELIPYLLWLFAKHGKKWPVPYEKMENLHLFLSGKRKRDLIAEGRFDYRALRKAKQDMFQMVGLKLPIDLCKIDNPDLTSFWLDQLLFHEKIADHPKFVVLSRNPDLCQSPSLESRLARASVGRKMRFYVEIDRSR